MYITNTIHNVYLSVTKSRMTLSVNRVARMGFMKNEYKISVGKPLKMKPL